jgi:aspartate/methionine/tyrosine aminotransferase
MTGERIAWAAVAAVLGEVLLSVGQTSAYLPVFALQAASSAALAGLAACGIRRLRDVIAPARARAGAAPGAYGGTR